MQNSLQRLFEGMAESLRESVAPAVEDPYARAQVMAAVELLGNLATRVEWRATDQIEAIERGRRVLRAAPEGAEEIVAPGLDGPVPDAGDAEGLEETRRRTLEALGSLQAWLDEQSGHDEIRADLSRHLLWELDADLARLRSGMYRSSSKPKR